MRNFSFRKKLYVGVSVAIVIVVFNAVANDLSLYWIFKWLDIPMHILGGMIAGYFGILKYEFLVATMGNRGGMNADVGADKKRGSNKVPLIIPILSALIVGISWEILEYYFGLSGLGDEFRADTFKDIINDMIGGIIIHIIWNFLYTDKNNKNRND